MIMSRKVSLFLNFMLIMCAAITLCGENLIGDSSFEETREYSPTFFQVGEMHGKFKRIDPVTRILTLRQNALRFLAMKKNTEFLKRAIRTSCSALVRILCLLPTHAAFPHVKISNIK